MVARPAMTYLLLTAILGSWLLFQDAGHDRPVWAASVCAYGLTPGELTGLAPVGTSAPLGDGLACPVDVRTANLLTPLTAMFLHGGWGHVLRNVLLLWLFGRSVEQAAGWARFLFLYLTCGIVGAAVHVIMQPASAAPTVGASGAIAGVLGAYVALRPSARVIRAIPFPGWLIVLWLFAWLILSRLPQLVRLRPDVGGTALWAHLVGFVAGVAIAKLWRGRRVAATADLPSPEPHRDQP